MKINLIRKTICTFFASAALLVIAFVIYAGAQYSVSLSLGDWILALLPILLAAFVNLLVYPISKVNIKLHGLRAGVALSAPMGSFF